MDKRGNRQKQDNQEKQGGKEENINSQENKGMEIIFFIRDNLGSLTLHTERNSIA